MTQKDIAQHLQVCPSTISRELRRNQSSLEQSYQATSAHQQAQKRCQRSPYKLRGELALQVKTYLTKRWSDEQISGVLALANNGQKCLSHEAIYQHIYRQKSGSESLIGYLRIRHKKRYKKRGSPQKRGSIPPGSVASMRTQMQGGPCRLIRQYIPKGQRISLMSEEFVSAPAARFDSR